MKIHYNHYKKAENERFARITQLNPRFQTEFLKWSNISVITTFPDTF